MSFSFIISVSALALLAAWLEWRRRNARQLGARLVCSTMAVAALALLGASRIDEETTARTGTTHATLWTSGATADTPAAKDATGGDLQFVLPGVLTRPAGAIAVPDVAYIRRHTPEIGSLRIMGDGLEPFDLPAVEGLKLALDADGSRPSRPAITVANFPRLLSLGGNLVVQGRIEGLAAGETARLVFQGPQENATEITVNGRADAPTPFEISGGSPAAEGQFVWQLKMNTGSDATWLADERIGVAVVRPMLPRVLVLESSPRLETSHLRRWFSEIGGALQSRTLVGRDRYRFAATDLSDAAFSVIDAELLKRFDLVIADPAAVLSLTTAEREAVRVAIVNDGLGLLLLAGSEPLRADATDDAAFFLSWKTARAGDEAAPNETNARAARLRWPGLTTPLEHPVPVAPLVFEESAGEIPLVSDSQGAPVVTSFRRGRGEIALSLVLESWRWRLDEQSPTFARYWSYLLHHVAKPQTSETPQWRIATAAHTPILPNQPLSLVYSAAGAPAGAAEITSAETGERTVLPLAQDPTEPQNWRATVWPRHAGWHRVTTSPGGAYLNFLVHEPDEWTSLAPARRRASTAAFVARSKPRARQEPLTSSASLRSSQKLSPPLLFAMFLLSAGYLWVERRRAINT